MRVSRGGFTLSELMIAAVILVVVIVGLLSVSVSCLLINESNKSLTIAANDAQYVLEQIKGLTYSQIPSYTPGTFSNLNGEAVTVSVSSGSTVTGVTVNVNWTERQRQRTFSLATRIAR